MPSDPIEPLCRRRRDNHGDGDFHLCLSGPSRIHFLCMKRFNLYLTVKQKQGLVAIAKRDEVKVAQLIRLAIEQYLWKHERVRK